MSVENPRHFVYEYEIYITSAAVWSIYPFVGTVVSFLNKLPLPKMRSCKKAPLPEKSSAATGRSVGRCRRCRWGRRSVWQSGAAAAAGGAGRRTCGITPISVIRSSAVGGRGGKWRSIHSALAAVFTATKLLSRRYQAREN